MGKDRISFSVLFSSTQLNCYTGSVKFKAMNVSHPPSPAHFPHTSAGGVRGGGGEGKFT